MGRLRFAIADLRLKAGGSVAPAFDRNGVGAGRGMGVSPMHVARAKASFGGNGAAGADWHQL